MFASQKIKSLLGLSAVGILAATALSGCVVSDDPAVNALATTATVGTVAGLIYYSNHDGYYYDDDYTRLPRTYRPARNVYVRRIDSMERYRRLHPLSRHQHRMYQQRIYRQQRENRILEQRLRQQREYNSDMRERIERQREHNLRQYRQRRDDIRQHLQQQRDDRSDLSRHLQNRQGQNIRSGSDWRGHDNGSWRSRQVRDINGRSWGSRWHPR